MMGFEVQFTHNVGKKSGPVASKCERWQFSLGF